MDREPDRVLRILLITVLVVSTGLLALPTQVVAQSSEGQLSLNQSQISLSPGEKKQIDVTFQAPPDTTVTGVQYNINYDSDVIRVTDQSQGSYMSGSVLRNAFGDETNDGVAEYLESRTDGGVSGAGTTSTITIEAADGFEDGATTDISFSGVFITDQDNDRISTTTSSSSVTVEITVDQSVRDAVAGQNAPVNELTFDDLVDAIEAYHADEPVGGETVSYDDLVQLIGIYQSE